MDVGSNWKIVQDPLGVTPVVLANYGDRLADELKFPIKQQVDDRSLLDAAEMDWTSRLLRSSAFSLTVFREFSDDATARNSILSGLAALRWDKVPLRIIVNGGASYQFATSILTDATPQMVVCGVARVSWTFNFNASGFAAV